MFKSNSRITIFFLCLTVFAACVTKPEKNKLSYEPLDAGHLNDSLSARFPNYRENRSLWKMVSEQCMHDSLFRNALYLGLQDQIGLGSISNQTSLNINKQISVLDTSAKSNIFDLIAIYNSANCFSKINGNKNMQDSFYTELVRILQHSGDYAFVSGLVDTSRIVFKIGTIIDYAIRPDSLVSILQRSTDSSKIDFAQILTTPGNAMMIRSVMIFGFAAQFHLKRKLSAAEAGKFKNEVYFKTDAAGINGSVKTTDDQNMQVTINKNYTVFGQFYFFRKNKL